MYIRRCRDMRTNQKIEILERRLERVGTELGILIAELADVNSKVEKEEIINQLIEIQDFANS